MIIWIDKQFLQSFSLIFSSLWKGKAEFYTIECDQKSVLVSFLLAYVMTRGRLTNRFCHVRINEIRLRATFILLYHRFFLFVKFWWPFGPYSTNFSQYRWEKGTTKKRKEKRRENNDIRGEGLRMNRIDWNDRTANWLNKFIS